MPRAWDRHPMGPPVYIWRTHRVKGVTEEDKIWLDGPTVIGLTDLVPRANEELAQRSLKPIVGRYSKSPGYRVLATYAWITLKSQNRNPSANGILEDTRAEGRSSLQGKTLLTTFGNIQVESYKEKTWIPRKRGQPSTTIKTPIPSQIKVRVIYPL